MEDVKFSLIIPAYNVSNYIVNCIKSITNQEYSNYEIIIINDGSTDETEEKIKKLDDASIKIINKENGGLSSARNEGVKYATGDYIWFVDGDDEIESNALTILNEYLKIEKNDILSFRYYRKYKEKKVMQVDNIRTNNLKEYVLVNTSACTKLFKRDFYIKNKFNFNENIIYEDLALVPFIMTKAKKVKFIEEPLYIYYNRKTSIMNIRNKFNSNRDDKFKAIDQLYTLFKNERTIDNYKVELEYLAIKHLLLVYSTEILPFSSKVYKSKCKKVIKYLNNINDKWKKNIYIKKSSIKTQIYIYLFRKKFFLICKLLLIFKRK